MKQIKMRNEEIKEKRDTIKERVKQDRKLYQDSLKEKL